MTYKAALRKRHLEAIIMYPFVLAGKVFSIFCSLKTRHEVFIFCPSADIGGSVKVSADLCSCFIDKNPVVIFSKKPRNKEFLSLFTHQGIKTIDLHKYVDNKIYHFVNFFFRGIVSSWINKVDNPIVVGGESLFFYKVLPHIKKKSLRADVCHLNTWFNYTQAFIKDLDARIFSTLQLKRDAIALYQKNILSEKYYSRLHFIDNKVDIPHFEPITNSELSVIFVGRGAPQKRIHIIAAIANKIRGANSRVHFSFVGDVEKIINPHNYPYCTFYGNVRDRNKIEEIYKNADVLLLTSAYEGLPLAVMEMMAYGKVVVSTAVGGIADYITNEVNGFLLPDDPVEEMIISGGVTILQRLASNKDLLKFIGNNSRHYAENHFTGKIFCNSYRKILLQGSSHNIQ